MNDLSDRLLLREQRGNLRELPRNQQLLIDFCSNDYLGLSRSKRLKSLFIEEIQKIEMLGATGSRLLSGNSFYAEQLEEKIATFHGFESGLLVGSGYLGNLALASLPSKDDRVFFDSEIHASLRNGIRFCQSSAFPFRHNDLNHLEKRLQVSMDCRSRWIFVESIYSTSGHLAPLEELSLLAERYQAKLIVDEAHAVGIFGPSGKGLVFEKGLTRKVFALLVTFGKALGTYGAIILGRASLKRFLINFGEPCIYTTALPSYALSAIYCAYQMLPEVEEERSSLYQLIKTFEKFSGKGSKTPIQALPFPGNEAAKQMALKLMKGGFDVKPLLSPTIRKGKEVLRICLHSYNKKNEIEALFKCLRIP